uniref:Zgc:110045 n=1 Tax=Salarias fasciatus TaxID=181472 RepID=A0A672H685_SALFA
MPFTPTLLSFHSQESGARINISEGSSPERIVTITGPTEEFVWKRLNDITAAMTNSNVTSKPPVTLRLVFPGSQCGSLIGKGGSKIKEIRETTGAQVQVAGDMLPDSTERAVTISGTPQAITQCVRHICSVMLESPPKGATIPYRPKILPVGAHAVLAPQHSAQQWKKKRHRNMSSAGIYMFSIPPHPPPPPHPSLPQFIGCIIGRQGSKINEIRQVSGAHIKIASATDGSAMRQVTITGSPASISVAQYLINASLEMAKYTMQAASSATPVDLNMTPNTINVHSPSTLPAIQNPHYAVPVSSLLGMKTLPVLAVHPAAASGLAQGLSPYTAKIPSSSGVKKSERQKFAPY